MRRRRELEWKRGLRPSAAACAWLFFLFLLSSPAVAFAILPNDFIARMPVPGDGQAAISSDFLSQDANGIITASGQVDMAYAGYFASADRLVFDQKTKDLQLIGHVYLRDPQGAEYQADQVVVTGNLKKAILNALVMVTKEGALVTASAVDHNEDTVTVLDDATYAPCGTCIDASGNRIGWRIRAEHMVYDEKNELVDLTRPTLEILGVPVAWLPWIRIPDPSNPRAAGFRLPSYGLNEKIGLKFELPYFMAVGDDIDLTFAAAPISRQGLLLGGTITQRFGSWGQYSATASGLYQLDRGAFSGTVGDRDWRGAIQTSSKFTPAEHWTVGTAYSLLSDRAYLGDYLMDKQSSAINQIYAEYLTQETYGLARAQEFVLLGNYDDADQDKQAVALPAVHAEHTETLADDSGQIRLTTNLLNAVRADDSTETVNGVTYVLGHEEDKAHAMAEAGWTKQWVTSNGVLVTPYAALRGDWASYDGASVLAPTADNLYSLTPIAALDVRYPFAAVDGGSVHVVEPIGQLVYRGSDTTAVGITNDDAQSFVFDDANLFSYDRFSGSDRQETGLRVNVGGHYLADFADGSYLDLVGGQSFFLAGTNALSVGDTAQTGTSSGLEDTASYIVAGLKGAVDDHFSFGAKMQIDPATAQIKRSALAGKLNFNDWALSLDYAFVAADADLGALTDQQDVGGSIHIPLPQYWSADVGAGWNITDAELVSYTAALTYDDDYFAVTGSYTAKGADPAAPDSEVFKVTFKLRGPDGAGYSF